MVGILFGALTHKTTNEPKTSRNERKEADYLTNLIIYKPHFQAYKPNKLTAFI